MAMTKKEAEVLRAALERADTLMALRWTDPVNPDIPPPSDGCTEGWVFNSYSKKVERGWSTNVSHGTGEARKAGSQKSCWLFSTKANALAAMRNEIEMRSAKILLDVDRCIAAERLTDKDISEMAK